MPQSTRNVITLTSSKNDEQKLKSFSKNKKNQINFINLSKQVSKIQLTPQSEILHHSSQKDSAKMLKK